MRRLPVTRSVLAILALSACKVPDKEHCLHRDGNLTCVELGLGNYCSSCRADNNGCAMQVPQVDCRVTDDAGGGTEDDTTSGADASGSGTTDGLPPECTAVNEPDPACPAEAAFCVGQACVACEAAPEGACAELDPSRPVCVASWDCATCIPGDGSTCPDDAPLCDDTFQCTSKCTRHADCPGSACAIAEGTCFDTRSVRWVNVSTCGAGATGTENDPYCTLQEALSTVPEGTEAVVMLVDGGDAYAPATSITGDRRVAVLGVGRPVIQSGSAQIAMSVGFARVYVSGIDLVGGSASNPVARCSSNGQLALHDVLVTGGGAEGIEATSCRLRVDRTRVLNNAGHGILLVNNSRLKLRNSVVAGNGNDEEATRGLFAAFSPFDIAFSTFADNRSLEDPAGGANFFCMAGDSTGPVRGSVFVGPQPATFRCPWAEVSHSVLDVVPERDLGGNVIMDVYDETWFVDAPGLDFHVRDSDDHPFVDVGVWEFGDPFVDLDGAPRMVFPGATQFAGADQP